MLVETESKKAIAEAREMPDDGDSLARFDVECRDDRALVKCYGRLISGAVPEFSLAVNGLLPRTNVVVVDLAGLTYIDAAGLGSIMRLRATARKAACRVKVMHLGKQLRRVIRLRNALSVFGRAEEHGITIA